jgi:predicted Rossmann-fold nucleotide-binding protein
VVLFGRDYWREVINFDALVTHGMIGPRDLDLFRIVDTPEEAWEWLTAHGLKAHTPIGGDGE